MTILEKRQKRGECVQQMRALSDKSDAEKRSMSAEELQNWERLDAEQERLRAEVETEEGDTKRRARLAELQTQLASSAPGATGTRAQPGDGGSSAAAATQVRTAPSDHPEYVSLYDRYLRAEIGIQEARIELGQLQARAETLQVGLFAKAGALVMPQQMAEGLIKSVDDETFMLQICNVERLAQAESLGIGTLDTDVDDAEWTPELKTGSDTDLAIGRREMRPHALAKRAKVSNALLRRTAGGAAALVNQRLAYKFAVAFEKGCISGTGARQPLGMFVASDDGVPTSRDVVCGSATEITPDGLIDVKHTLKAAYWRNARWLFGRTALKQLRKAKTGDGQYLWVPGLAGGTGDRILDLAYLVSEFVPATFTANQYVGMLADFRAGYSIAIALDMTVQVLTELYAEANKTGYIGRMEADGMPVLPEAFVRLKLAAS